MLNCRSLKTRITRGVVILHHTKRTHDQRNVHEQGPLHPPESEISTTSSPLPCLQRQLQRHERRAVLQHVALCWRHLPTRHPHRENLPRNPVRAWGRSSILVQPTPDRLPLRRRVLPDTRDAGSLRHRLQRREEGCRSGFHGLDQLLADLRSTHARAQAIQDRHVARTGPVEASHHCHHVQLRASRRLPSVLRRGHDPTIHHRRHSRRALSRPGQSAQAGQPAQIPTARFRVRRAARQRPQSQEIAQPQGGFAHERCKRRGCPFPHQDVGRRLLYQCTPSEYARNRTAAPLPNNALARWRINRQAELQPLCPTLHQSAYARLVATRASDPVPKTGKNLQPQTNPPRRLLLRRSTRPW